MNRAFASGIYTRVGELRGTCGKSVQTFDLSLAKLTQPLRPLSLGLGLLLGILTGCGGTARVAGGVGGGGQPPPVHEGIVITVSADRFAQLAVRETDPFTALADYGDGVILPQDVTRKATWSTSDATVATVEKGGLVTSIATGSATITASFDGAIGTATVVVNQKPTIGITVNPSGDMFSLSSQIHPEFSATAVYPDNSHLDATYDVAWTADPRGILGFGVDSTYQAGIANLVAVGKTTVTAKLKTGETGTYDVTVVP